MCLHDLKIYLMLLICYVKLPLQFLSISLCLFNLCSYTFVNIIWIMLLSYILISYFIIIPVDTTTIFLRWTRLIHNTHLAISWKIPSLMNWANSYSPIFRKIMLSILWPRVTFLCMLSYFNVGGRQKLFILYLVIFSIPYLLTWDVERVLPTGSSINQLIFMGASLQALTILKRTWFCEFVC